MAIASFHNYNTYFTQSEADGYNVYQVQLGELHIPSGQIIACDPFFSYEQQPLNKTVTPGSYPVTLAIAEVEATHFRVGLAKIQFSKSKAIFWELAVTQDVPAHELAMLGPNEFIGYEVEAGLGMFIDADFNQTYLQILKAFYQQNENVNYYDEVLAAEFRKTSGNHPYSRNLGDWNVHCPTKNPTQNSMMFASGWGDGLYPSYWGLNEEGEVVELITDFLIFGKFE
ncbi:MAG: DUF4241 domain-containing protein [Flammeovirgaceae bacterium]